MLKDQIEIEEIKKKKVNQKKKQSTRLTHETYTLHHEIEITS